jgi:hypothetical protein
MPHVFRRKIPTLGPASACDAGYGCTKSGILIGCSKRCTGCWRQDRSGQANESQIGIRSVDSREGATARSSLSRGDRDGKQTVKI